MANATFIVKVPTMTGEKCLNCNETILIRKYGSKFCSAKCALIYRNLHDKEFQEKKIRGLRTKCSKEIPKSVLEYLYFEEKLTQKEIAHRLGVSESLIKNKFDLYSLEGRK